jgi:hypothetical protein
MAALKIFGFALSVSFALCGFAQTPIKVQPGNLELRLQPESVRSNIPQAFTVLIVNRSDHDMRIPMPSLECGDVAHGTVGLRLHVKPLHSGPIEPTQGCFKDFGYQPILDRVKEWKVLRPEESVSLGTINDRVIAPGAYEYWAYYYPPGMPKADEDLLQKAGIDFPRNELESAHVKFVKKR